MILCTLMFFLVILVCEILDMLPRHIPLAQLRDDLGNVHETLTNIDTVLQPQVEAGPTPIASKG